MSEELLAEGAAISERHLSDARSLDRAYLTSISAPLTKPIQEVTLADIQAAQKPYRDLVKQIFERDLEGFDGD